ncbi:hypothetical protein ADK87_00055 [Streptomyces sp. NRRL F-4711]|nr:hypothetical protein ADK87_00055 [Streptomyces sp. NRRL F-4711]
MTVRNPSRARASASLASDGSPGASLGPRDTPGSSSPSMPVSTGLCAPPPDTTSRVTPCARQASATVTAVSLAGVARTSSGRATGAAGSARSRYGRWKCSLPVLFGAGRP